MDDPEITADTVREAARLSRIAVDDAEVERMRGQLAALVRYVGKLQELEVEGVASTGHPLGRTIVERADDVVPSPDRAVLLDGAPAHDGEHFLVPRVIDQD
ncbi:MAG: Asp-tRNA(Asn)/Glu-tRNA(Gln) amidotransferase subunit GatC [Planctomycetota bacterium]